MELFDEVKNRYFHLMMQIINECAVGKTKQEIIRIIDDGEFDQKVIGKNQRSFVDYVLNRCDHSENFHILTEKNGHYFPSVQDFADPPLPIRFTNIEKAWLKALLDQPDISLVLSDQTRLIIQAGLRDMDTPIRQEYMEMTNTVQLPEMTEPDSYRENFRFILEALINEKAIRYHNRDRKGNVHKDKLALPVSLEYAMRDGRFRVSMFSIDDNRPIMANLTTLSKIRVVQETIPIDRETAKKVLWEKVAPEPVVLEVTDKKGAMERSFMCFSGMDRSAKQIAENTYELRLNYYVFDEENLIRNILSLGPYVKVISPQRIIDEVIRRVKRSYEFAAE
ncbi:WYL domain-containing protein [Dehalobacter sp. DCM]|uniref:WYL domain-containing protein n=1 Tax=Dehalobacter sp. DCM TaxID=2907827 RepID=UPI0030812826|nr:WYL domain-containing protein [Dehalobacter sp. DCM]